MITVIALTFVIGYLAIVLEHPLKLDKTIPALLMGAIIWAIISTFHLPVVHMVDGHPHLGEWEPVLLHHVGKIGEILFFLIGAMTIVELVDLHKGFSVITNRIQTTKKSSMLWIVSILAFLMSAVLDNLTTTIVFVSMLRRLVPVREERIYFVSMVIIAANAGGAWSPIGDVTTTMLWIGKKVSTGGLISHLVIPSLLCLVIPVLVMTFMPYMRGSITPSSRDFDAAKDAEKVNNSRIMLFAGLGALIFVPIFKTVTHLPPYMGMMIGLAVVWLVSEFTHPGEHIENKHQYSAHHALSRIELSSILFFLGILIGVAGLESVAVSVANGQHEGLLMSLAGTLDRLVPNQDVVVILLGVLSAVIDNVPLVAASMGMYNFPMDDPIWHFIAYSAGTGGSMLIIGSAAGVAAMGMERINFIWYFKQISWLAFLGFIGGALAFILEKSIF
jgi:Na+/H+ antiporter NhaD/arsenite permease-like protein